MMSYIREEKRKSAHSVQLPKKKHKYLKIIIKQEFDGI